MNWYRYEPVKRALFEQYPAPPPDVSWPAYALLACAGLTVGGVVALLLSLLL